MQPLTIVIVEDEMLLHAEYERVIGGAFSGSVFYTLTSSQGLVETAKQVKPDLVITDLVMDSTHEGISGISRLREYDPQIPIIVVSGHSDFLEIADAFRIDGRLQKPINDNQLIEAINNVLGVAS